jgi:uncharacterized membrane-anchored protein
MLFYALIFLLASLYPIPIKTDLIVNKAEKNAILHENQDKFEISFQKISSEKSFGKDGILKKEDGRNFGKVSKEARKKEKLTTTNERDKNNPRFLQDEGNYIIIYYGADAYYGSGFREDNQEGKITNIIYENQNYESTSELEVTAGSYIKVYIDSSTDTLSSFFDNDILTAIEKN